MTPLATALQPACAHVLALAAQPLTEGDDCPAAPGAD